MSLIPPGIYQTVQTRINRRRGLISTVTKSRALSPPEASVLRGTRYIYFPELVETVLQSSGSNQDPKTTISSFSKESHLAFETIDHRLHSLPFVAILEAPTHSHNHEASLHFHLRPSLAVCRCQGGEVSQKLQRATMLEREIGCSHPYLAVAVGDGSVVPCALLTCSLPLHSTVIPKRSPTRFSLILRSKARLKEAV
jgi:hypothetical protein